VPATVRFPFRRFECRNDLLHPEIAKNALFDSIQCDEDIDMTMICDARWLRERVEILLELGLFRQAFAEIHRHSSWETDPEALRLFGSVVQRFAPRSNDRSCAYGIARGFYWIAMDHARERPLRAEILADLAESYFEEGRLDDASEAFEASRSIYPREHRAHLGLIAIACATRELAEIRERCAALARELPTWHEHRGAVASLVTDPDFAFLLASRELFLDCLAGTPDDLRALHDRHCLESLAPALASFDDREQAEPACLLEVTEVVHQTFVSVEPRLRRRTSTLGALSPEPFQARIGF